MSSYFDDLLRAWKVGKKPQTNTLSQPISKDVARTMTGFDHRRTWKCECGAELSIRARHNRPDGPSNLEFFPDWHKLAGQPSTPSGLLTWNGMAVERGWDVAPVTCPACKAGMTVKAYKAARRQGGF